jgi:crotonobetainyl-CoA:carnitine CoA-transferase CaiB-like acyl-CoA transferase
MSKMGAGGMLEGLRVVELAGRSSARVAGALLAALGADVVRVESDFTRDACIGGLHPVVAEHAMRVSWDRNKRVITLEPGDKEAFEPLVREADVLLTSAESGADEPFVSSRGGVAYSGIQVLLTPFGASGPYKTFRGDELNTVSYGGLAVYVGEAGREPIVPPFMIASFQAGMAAVIGALGALLGGGRQLLDIGEFETLATSHMTGLYSLSLFSGPIPRRAGRRKPNPYPFTALPCADGWVCVAFLGGHQWSRLLRAMDNPQWSQDPRFADRRRMGELHADELDSLVSAWLRSYTKDELREMSVEHRIPLGPMHTIDELLGYEQFRKRGFLESTLVDRTEIQLPALPFQDQVARAAVTARPTAEDRSVCTAAPTQDLPLAGVKVLDLSWVMSGPMAAQWLADMGADVIKVESRTHLDASRQGLPLIAAEAASGDAGLTPNVMPHFNAVNRGKRSIVLDLASEGGKAVFYRLLAGADVLVENIGARALERLALPMDRIHAHRPGLVALRISMAGQEGPDSRLPGYAPQSTAIGGMDAVTGYPGEDPVGTISLNLGDITVAGMGAIAVLAALRRARRTGVGTTLDLSMIEVHALTMSPQFAARQLDGADLRPVGNQHRSYFPHGIYRCLGEDEWVSIAVRDEDEWRALGTAIDAPSHAAELDSVDKRRVVATEIEGWISRWAASRTSLDAFLQLQDAGVPAAPAWGVEELMTDAHARDREVVVHLEHHLMGFVPVYGSPLHGQPSMVRVDRRAPDLGEHTQEILAEAGFDEQGVSALARDGAFDGIAPRSTSVEDKS